MLAVPAAVLRAAGPAALRPGQQPQVAHAAPEDPAQHVAAALVGRQHPVGDQHHRGAHVVGDDPQRDVGALLVAVLLLGQLGGPVQHPPHGVDLVDVVHALQERGHPLQAHPGVDVLAGQLAEDREVLLAGPFTADELHEDQVPDLQVAVLVGDRSPFAAVLRAAVVIDLRARAARPGHAHRPEVVGHAAALDPVQRNADVAVPDVRGLVVVVEHGDPQPVFGEAEAAVRLRAGQQLPGVRDRLFLEVVAEREVAQHLEERAVPGGLADFLDVRGAHALLRGGGPPERRHLLAEEVRLERRHPGVDQEQGRVVGDQAGRRHHGVAVPLEEAEKPAGDLSRFHHRPSFAWLNRERPRCGLPRGGSGGEASGGRAAG